MNAPRATRQGLPAWLMRIASTVPRCHMFGSITAASLIVCITWVWSQNSIEVATIQFRGTIVDLGDAAALIDNADQWRQLYTVNYHKSQDIDKRANSIASWLPRSVDWSKTQQDIQSIGDAVELSILAIKRGDDHVGTRVGITVASCDVEGSYSSLCRFLSELSKRPQPIACSEIALHRTINEVASERGDGKPQCRATLSLRIPFAASGTAAGRLLQTEANNAG